MAAVEGRATRTSNEPTSAGGAGVEPDTADLPAEVVPQRIPTRVAPVTKTKPTRRLRPGDLICGQCGEGNQPTRKFCSRCGEELGAATVVKTRWYQKLWRRKPKTMEAGARPGQPGAKTPVTARARQGWMAALRVVGVFTMGIALLVVFVPPLRAPIEAALGHPVEKVKSWWADKRDPYDSVFPVDWKANRQPQSGHLAQAAFDNNTQSYWSTVWRPKNARLDTYLTVIFSEPVKNLVVFVYAGAPGEDFTKYHSPRELRFDYGDGRPNDSVELTRQEGVQPMFKLEHADGVTEFTIWVEDVHDQKGATHVAVSEFEFKQKK